MPYGYYYNHREDEESDYTFGIERAGWLGPSHWNDPIGVQVGTTHFAAITMAADAVVTLNGLKVGDVVPRPRVIIVRRRDSAEGSAARRRGRRIRGARVLSPTQDYNEVLGDLVLTTSSVIGLNATVVVSNQQLGQLVLVGDAVLKLPGGIVLDVQPGQGLTMVGDAVVSLTGKEIFAGQLKMVADAQVVMRGTGGADASVDPTKRRQGLVAIGIRGGHS